MRKLLSKMVYIKHRRMATNSVLTLRQLKREIKRKGYTYINALTLTVGTTKTGTQLLHYQSSFQNGYCEELCIIKGSIEMKRLTALSLDFRTITPSQLLSLSVHYEVFHSDLIFTESYISCSCCFHGTIPVTASMSLTDILSFTRSMYASRCKEMVRAEEALFEELKNLEIENRLGLSFKYKNYNGHLIEVRYDHFELESSISLSDFNTLQQKGIEAIGIEVFYELLTQGRPVFVDGLYYKSNCDDTICEDCGRVVDKVLVATLHDAQGWSADYQLGKDIESTYDLIHLVHQEKYTIAA